MLFRDIVYYRCRDCGKVFVKHERFKSVLRYCTDETPMCPECFSRRTNPPGIGWLFRIKELLSKKSKKIMSRRTLDDLSDEEYEDYEKNPENYQDVTDATNEDIASMMGDYEYD